MKTKGEYGRDFGSTKERAHTEYKRESASSSQSSSESSDAAGVGSSESVSVVVVSVDVRIGNQRRCVPVWPCSCIGHR